VLEARAVSQLEIRLGSMALITSFGKGLRLQIQGDTDNDASANDLPWWEVYTSEDKAMLVGSARGLRSPAK
jgi:hypothetical protein